MDFRILGSIEVLDGTGRVEVPAGRGRALLAMLILHAGEPVAAERIVDELWGEDPPRTAGTIVQELVSRLRRVFEPGRARGAPSELLQTVGSGYLLATDPGSIDANRFKRLLDEARDATPEARSAKLSAALHMWRGPALADFTYEPFAQRAIAALEELRIQAIEDRLEADLALGRSRELVGELEGVIAAHPFRERLRGFLMLALYRAGRQVEALEAYRGAHSLLIDEIGLEPGPALRELQSAILRQDPALELQPATREAEPTDTAPSSWLPHERRTVTVVAMDLAPAAQPSVDPEAVGRIGSRAAHVAADVLGRHGARVERLFGDMLMAFFGFPLAHEDDALRAARAALEARTAVHALDDDPTRVEGVRNLVRAGIETGDIMVAGPGAAIHDVVTGTVMAAAARLQQAAGDGEVIIGPAAARLLRGTVILKAIEGAQATAWRVLEVVAGAPFLPGALGAPMFGRQDELTRIRSAFRRAVRSGSVVRMTVLGEAGIGKSRLAREFVDSIAADADVITQRCPTYGEGTFLPLREAIVEAAGLRGWRALHDLLGRGDHDRRALSEIADAMGLRAEPGSAAALFPAMRRLLETLASERPLVVVYEDLHWAEPTFLDLVDHVVREAIGRIFLLCLARTDLIERRPELDQQDRLLLGPLSSNDLQSLVLERAGSITPDSLHRIVEVSEGNPLFAEQLLAALDDTSDALPGSLRGLLTTRLDSLGPGERDVLRCAAIAGMDVEPEAVCALLPDDARPFVERHLDALERKRLIERAGTEGFRFRHALIRLAAYQSMTREDRARLHERFAVWLEQESSDRRPELAQFLGYHLEQADEHRRATGTAPVAIVFPVSTYKTDPRVDQYIGSLPAWQQDICRKVRDLVHAADPDVIETIKRTKQPYFTLDGNICALLGAKDHVNVFIYDPIAPDPEGLINQGHGNVTARAIQIRRGDDINERALVNLFKAVIANNRAGGWRHVKANSD
jgi:DNA-binding SARP family transcriptional activator